MYSNPASPSHRWIARTRLSTITNSHSIIPRRRRCQRSPTRLISIIRNITPLIALERALRKRSWQLRPVIRNVHVRQPARVGEVGLHDLRGVDEEVLGCAGDAGVFARQGGDEDGGLAVVVEFPVEGALRADGGLVEADFGVDGLICGCID